MPQVKPTSTPGQSAVALQNSDLTASYQGSQVGCTWGRENESSKLDRPDHYTCPLQGLAGGCRQDLGKRAPSKLGPPQPRACPKQGSQACAAWGQGPGLPEGCHPATAASPPNAR